MNVLIKVYEDGRVAMKKQRQASKREKYRALRYDRPTPVAKYVQVSRNNPADKVLFEAFDATDFTGWEVGEHECEVVGKEIWKKT